MIINFKLYNDLDKTITYRIMAEIDKNDDEKYNMLIFKDLVAYNDIINSKYKRRILNDNFIAVYYVYKNIDTNDGLLIVDYINKHNGETNKIFICIETREEYERENEIMKKIKNEYTPHMEIVK